MNKMQVANLEMQGMAKRIEELELERDQLAASNERLRGLMSGYLESIDMINQEMILSEGLPTAVNTDDGWSALNETPSQSLAEHDARVIEKAAREIANTLWRDTCGVDDVRQWLLTYAGDIRLKEEMK